MPDAIEKQVHPPLHPIHLAGRQVAAEPRLAPVIRIVARLLIVCLIRNHDALRLRAVRS